MDNWAFLILRLVAGSLLAGHGAQKLFGWFEGPGPRGTHRMVESMGLRPGRPWALLAGASEFGGGLLTALGLFGPLGPVGVTGAMSMATVKVHAGKPIWVTSGGAELPVTNMAIAAALMLAGPGKFSLDRALGLKVPAWLALPGLLVVAGTVAMGMQQSEENQAAAPAGRSQTPAGHDGAGQPHQDNETAGAGLRAGKETAHPV